MSTGRVFRVLHLRQLRRQPLRTVLAVIAVAAGVSLMVASGLLVVSLERSVGDVLVELGGPAPLRIDPRTAAGLDPVVAERAAAVRGVGSVVPAVHALAVGESVSGRETYIVSVGVDCRVEALVGPFGCDAQAFRPPRPDAPVLMSSSLARSLGRDGVIRTYRGRIPIDGVAVNDTLDEFNRGRVAVYRLPTAQRVFGRGDRLDAVYVLPESGADLDQLQVRLEQAVGDWNNVGRRGERPVLWQSGAGPLMPLLALVAFIALGLSGLLVYNIVSLSLAERRRDLAVAGAVGVAPRAMTAGTLGEAGLMGVFGGAVGAIAGIGFAHPIVRSVSSSLTEQGAGIPLRVHVSPLVLVTGVVLGAITAVVAAWIPARRARRLDLAGELHGRAVHVEDAPEYTRRRLIVLLLASGAAVGLSHLARRGGALEPWQPPVGTLALVATAMLVFAAAGAAAPLLLEVVMRPLRRTAGPLRVAVANLVRRPRRTGVIAAAVAAAVGMACVLSAIFPAIRGSVTATYGEASEGRVRVSTVPINNSWGIDARPSPQVLAGLAALPGVESVDRDLGVTIGDEHGELSINTTEGSRIVPYRVVAGSPSLRALERGEAIIGTSAARDRRLHPGSTFRIPTPTGVAELRVSGIVASSENNGYSATISPARFEELFGPQPAIQVFLRPARGVSAQALVRRVEAANIDPDLYALTPDEYVAQLSEEVGDQAAPFWVVQRALLFVSLVATLSTLLLVGVQRRRELGVLGAVGFGPVRLARMTLAEGAASGGAGALLGVVASLGLFESLRNVSVAAVGVQPPFRFEPLAAVLAAGLAVLVVAIGGLLPAWRTARMQIVEAIRDE